MSNQTNEIMHTRDLQEENGRDEADYLSFRPGQRLRKARELRGMTIEQIAQELNLAPRYVLAMESDSYKDLPEPAFVRGYMRRYAQLVKLSPDDIAAKFDQCYAEDKETPALEVRPRNPIQVLGVIARQPKLRARRLLSWGALVFVVILVAGFLWSGIAARNAIPVVDAPALPAEQALGVPVVPEVSAPPVAPGVATPPAATAVPAAPPATTAPVAPAAPTQTAPAPAPATPGMNVLPAPAGPAMLPSPGASVPGAPAPAPATPAPNMTR